MPILTRMPATLVPTLARALAGLTLALALPVEAAEYRDPGRVGRIAELQGDVALYDAEDREWTDAVRNRPLVAGDRLVLQRSARAELRVGATVLLLGQGADLEVDALDEDRLRLTLHDGALALRLDGRDDAEATEVRTAVALLRPQRAGRYRIDADRESTFAATLRGALEASGHGQLLLIEPGERHELWLDDRGARSRQARLPDDRLAAWADERFDAEDAWQARRDRRWQSAPAYPAIPGLDELDRHGRWDQHPEYGSVWLPDGLPAGWAPFSDGRWIWMRPWGWTWVDARPWGFAPSHYGRWLQWGGRWCWWPGPRQQRAIFAPAMVAWVGGSGVSVGISIGSRPPMGWLPLSPWQSYEPFFAPRPHPHGRPPGHRLPPPAPPLSRQPPAFGGGPGTSLGAGSPAGQAVGRPLPPGTVRYGSDGLPQQVMPAPGSRPGAPQANLPPQAHPPMPPPAPPQAVAPPPAAVPPAAVPPPPAVPRPAPPAAPRPAPPAAAGHPPAPQQAAPERAPRPREQAERPERDDRSGQRTPAVEPVRQPREAQRVR